MTPEQELLLLKHFFNQLTTLLGKTENQQNVKLVDLFLNPLMETNGMGNISHKVINEFVDKYKSGADSSVLTERGRKVMGQLDEIKVNSHLGALLALFR